MKKTENKTIKERINYLLSCAKLYAGTITVAIFLTLIVSMFFVSPKLTHAVESGANTGCIPVNDKSGFGTYTNRSIPNCYTLLEPIPCIGGVGTGQDCSNLKNGVATKVDVDQYIGYIFKISIAIAAALAVLRIIWGGFEYITSEIPGLKADAKETITNAILGLIFVLASYLILQTIDPRLVEVNTSLPPIKIETQSLDVLDKNTIDALNYAEINRRYNAFNDVLKEAQKLREEGDALMAKSELEPWNREALEKQAQEKYKAAEAADLKASAVALDGVAVTKNIALDEVLSKNTFLTEKDKTQIETIKKQLVESYDREIKTFKDSNQIELAQKYESKKEALLVEIDAKTKANLLINTEKTGSVRYISAGSGGATPVPNLEPAMNARKYAIELENNPDLYKNVKTPEEKAELQAKLSALAEKIRSSVPKKFEGEDQYTANYIKNNKK